jgi:hypothetical protein
VHLRVKNQLASGIQAIKPSLLSSKVRLHAPGDGLKLVVHLCMDEFRLTMASLNIVHFRRFQISRIYLSSENLGT